MIKEIKTIEALLSEQTKLENCTIQDLDFRKHAINWEDSELKNTTFLGCTFLEKDELLLRKKGAIIYPRLEGLPYNPYRKTLYNWKELMEGYEPENDQSNDIEIYKHFSDSRSNPDINEALAQRIHDHAIDDALRDLIGMTKGGMTKQKCVGIMGGHGTLRTNTFYTKTAVLAKKLAEEGYMIASGGGPGIMEAANLGAYFAGLSDKKFYTILQKLSVAPSYKHPEYISSARAVVEEYPEGRLNLAIPTWFYGHEPSNLFATHIAKYFSNSIREDTLLAIALYGIVFAPGSAGTTQEIFMDAAQNHYGTFGYYSPMIFLGRERYESETMLYPLLRQLSWDKAYHKLLHIADDPKSIVEFIKEHPPIKCEP